MYLTKKDFPDYFTEKARQYSLGVKLCELKTRSPYVISRNGSRVTNELYVKEEKVRSSLTKS